MPDANYGATPEMWRHWSDTLGLTADLLPVVSRPDAPISPNSKMKALGKTPSIYNQQRQAVGLPKWTEIEATANHVARWSKEPDYGISVQCRRLRAIDIDVTNKDHVDEIVRVIIEVFGTGGNFAERYRKNAEKILIPFWLDGELFKHTIPIGDEIIEILGNGQQFIAEGTHPSGDRYEWTGGEIPTLTREQFAMLLLDLNEFATGKITVARERSRGERNTDLETADDVAAWLIDNWETYDAGRDGQIFIACPFADQHTGESGESSTAYFPAGTGGYAEGHFVCLHAHCAGRSNAEFLHATGFTAGAFGVVDETDVGESGLDYDDGGQRISEGSAEGETLVSNRTERQALIEDERWPTLTRDSTGKIEPTMNNLLLALASPTMIGRHLAYDTFKDELMWAPNHCPRAEAQWRMFRDSDYAKIRQQLELRGFKPMGAEMLRHAVLTVSEDMEMDTATEWLRRLVWDGTPRIDTFTLNGWGWQDTPYSRAVGRYTWTALAGRVVQPGIQADMAPILVGPQGAGKTRAIKAMSPDPEFYASLKLDDHDADTSRLLRGTLVAELEELRGLNSSRAIEEIKAWVTKTHEKWVPKYREFATTFGRRCVFFGTTNEEEFLGDPTGERRWLPGKLDRTNPDWIARHREQLWAEGYAAFVLDGIDWQQAETLARLEHEQFKISDAWTPLVARWLHAEDDMARGAPVDWPWIDTHEILEGAIGMARTMIGRGHEMRIGKIMKELGFYRKKFPPRPMADKPKAFYGYVRG